MTSMKNQLELAFLLLTTVGYIIEAPLHKAQQILFKPHFFGKSVLIPLTPGSIIQKFFVVGVVFQAIQSKVIIAKLGVITCYRLIFEPMLECWSNIVRNIHLLFCEISVHFSMTDKRNILIHKSSPDVDRLSSKLTLITNLSILLHI